jgi:hypothetical protein
MREARISWPSSPNQFAYNNTLITQQHPRLLGAFASIDGLSLLVQESPDQDLENATYNRWTSTHNVNSVLVYSPEGTVIFVHVHQLFFSHSALLRRYHFVPS